MRRLVKLIDKNALNIVLLWISILTILFSALSILRHDHFQSGGFDLGLYDQSVWLYSKFKVPYNTVKDRLILGDHLNLTLPLVAPLYWFWPKVHSLLIFQAFWASFSTLAVFLLCRNRKFSPLTCLNLSFLYSLFYGIQYLVFFDFHAVAIGVGLIVWLAYFLESGKNRCLFLTLILLLLTQENMGLALVSLGLIYFFIKKFRKTAVTFMVVGLAWSLLASRIIASFSPVGFQYWPQIKPNPLAIFQDFFNAEEKRQVWLYSLAWFSFLPIFSPGAMMAVLFNLAQYFATGPEFARMWSPLMHHRAILGLFLLLGTLGVLGKLKELGRSGKLGRLGRKKNFVVLISLLLVVSALCQQYFFHFPLNKLSKPIYWQTEPWMEDNQALIKQIPPTTSLAAQQNLVPHLSHRDKIYLVWPRKHDFEQPSPCGQVSCWWLDFGGQPDYLVVDTRPHQWLTQILESNENFQSAITNMEKAGRIGLVSRVNDAKLFKINY